MAKAYFGSKLSPNIIETPEGFLVCKNVPVARTGVQQYLGRELGLNNKYDDLINVYRTEDEVFNPKVIASFEGKAFTDNHPSDWVTPLNVSTYLKGTVTNVRRGEGNENQFLLADIIVYNPQQISDIKNKVKREISCGYECEYVPYKDGYAQKNIIGNHVALVDAGRAGNRVAIKDNMAADLQNSEGRKTKMKLPRKCGASDFVKSVGLKQFAQDAEPEEVMEIVDALTDEKMQAEKDAEPVIIEKEPETTNNEDTEEIKSQLAEVKDTLLTLLMRDENFEEPAANNENPNEDLASLDALEGEMQEEASDSEIDEINSIEKPAEEINDESAEENSATITTDDIKELLKVLKPVVAAMPAGQRKKASDDLSAVLKKHYNSAKKVEDSKSAYSNLANRTKDAGFDHSVNMGMEIAKKRNPHYMESK